MKNVTLRDYQKANSDKLIEAIKAGKKLILLKQAGGSGKTYTLLKTLDILIKEGVIKKAIFCTPRINLTMQTYKQIDAGYYQGNKSKDLDKPIIIANLHTLVKRPLKCDLVVFDEVHLLTTMINKYKDYKQAIGISATPYSSDASPLKGWEKAFIIDHSYDEKWLIKNNYLSPMQYFIANHMDYNIKINKSTGEITSSDAEKIVKENKLGDIVGSLELKIGEEALKKNRIVVSCQNINHAYILKEDFKNRGYKPLIVTSRDRKGLKNIEAFKANSEENILLFVDMVSTGTDIPNITDVVLARAFGSHTNYRQTVLRGTRLFEGKTHFNVWDFGDNLKGLGNPLKTPTIKKRLPTKEPKANCPAIVNSVQCQGRLYTYDRKIDMTELVIVLYKRCPICGHQEIDYTELQYIECSKCGKAHMLDKLIYKDNSYGVECNCGNYEVYEKVTSKPLQATLLHSKKEVREILGSYLKEPLLSNIVALEGDKVLAYTVEVIGNLNNNYTEDSKRKVIKRLINRYRGRTAIWEYITNTIIEFDVRHNERLEISSQSYLYAQLKRREPLTKRKVVNALKRAGCAIERD